MIMRRMVGSGRKQLRKLRRSKRVRGKNLLGEEHDQTLVIQNSLASVLSMRGDYKQAEAGPSRDPETPH